VPFSTLFTQLSRLVQGGQGTVNVSLLQALKTVAEIVKEVNDRWIRLGGIGLLWLRDVYLFGLLTTRPLGWDTLKYGSEFLLVTALSWEAARWIIIQCRHHYPHLSQTRKRIMLVLPLCWLAAVLVDLTTMVLINWMGYHKPYALGPNVLNIALGALVFSGFTIGMQEAVHYFNRLLQSERQAEALKKENLQTQLESLKHQVNPHFLFNSLNTLSYLIGEDTERAEEFLNQLCKVYRYLLRANEHELTDLATELQFIRSYYHLLRTRYGENLQLTIDVDPPYLTGLLPSLTLQLLVENAVKHNVIDKNQPLLVTISTGADGLLSVQNNLQRKLQQLPSTQIGLRNIATKFRLLNQGDIRVQQTDDHFTVAFPLITAGSPAAYLFTT